MILFNGYELAKRKERALQEKLARVVHPDQPPKIAAILFTEDAGSRLYTRLKQEAAARVGIEYVVFEHSLIDSVQTVTASIQQANQDQSVTGIIIQKPTRKLWEQVTATTNSTTPTFDQWWKALTSQIKITKDVDGLHPQTVAELEQGSWQKNGRVLPATCRAVLSILESATIPLQSAKVVIIGKSDLLGIPLFYVLKNEGVNVELLRRADLQNRIIDGRKLLDADVIISATGVPGVITGELLKPSVVVVDVGEPRGDIDQTTVAEKAAFLTPVPGGVGPLTVVSLLENAVELYTGAVL